MEKNLHNLYKPKGKTPLEAIKKFKQKYPSYADIKMTYAGRLDPMAQGVILILSGNEIFEKNKYLKLDKIYEADVLIGIKSDTYDILGIPKLISSKKFDKQILKKKIEEFKGQMNFKLPPFSSYKIKGKPLFEWARKNKLAEIDIPVRSIKIFSIGAKKIYLINAKKLWRLVKNDINLVAGDFRQEESLTQWREILGKIPASADFQIIKIIIHCESGTYIRSLADKLGDNLNSGAILLSLKRLKVGEFDIKDSIKL